MKGKFILALLLGGLWLAVSLFFAVGWAQEASYFFPTGYVWWVIIGIALLPGFLMSAMFFSNMMHTKVKKYPDTSEDTTVIMCAHNEEKRIARAIRSILHQEYRGHIRLIVVNNASTDHTKQEILNLLMCGSKTCSIEYMSCGCLGKAHALNAGLSMVCTRYFITVDADTCLEKHAVQKTLCHE